MSQQCDSKTCEPNPTSNTSCPAGDCECPIEGFTQKWEGAFCQAMGEVMVAQLRTRIEKQWGEMMGKEADALLASIGAQWGTKIAKVQAHIARESFKKTLTDNWLAVAGGGGKK